MRLNLPVTQQEREFDTHSSIVSKTDIGACITYVNPTFVAITGFTEEELMGAPQSIVRHPDMPEAVFGDMWSTLKGGRPWSGLLKNRCKNGDFYWAQTSITPTWERGVCSGYMMVCTQAARDDIRAAEKEYQRLNREYARISARRAKVDAPRMGRVSGTTEKMPMAIFRCLRGRCSAGAWSMLRAA